MSPSGARMSEAYGAFAYAFDRALGERFFRAMRPVLDNFLAKYPAAKRTHLDLACGTGLALEYFRARGWTSAGVDGSLPMLQLARKRSRRVIAADLRALSLRGRFARITSLYDSLNHLLELNELVAAFQAIRALMDEDSLLLFDMNHPDIYPIVWGTADPFISAGAGYRLEMHTTYRARERTGRAMCTGWALIGGERVQIRELHLQRAYTRHEIVTALDDAHLAPIDVMEFDPYHDLGSVDAQVVKLIFVCAPTASRWRVPAAFDTFFSAESAVQGSRRDSLPLIPISA